MRTTPVLILTLCLTGACADTGETAPATTTKPSTSPTTTTPPATAPPTTVPAAPDYDQASAWMCRPDTTDVCDGDVALTEVAADGSMTVAPSAPAEDRPVDCFYAYP